MDDEHVGQLVQHASFGDVHLFVAVFARILRDDLARDVLRERFVQSFVVLDLQREVVEVLLPVPRVLALVADQLRAGAASVHTVHEMFEGRFLQSALQLVEYHIQKLLRVLLDQHVNRCARKVLEGEAEFVGVLVYAVAEFEEAEHALELVQHVVVHHALILFDQIWLLQVVCGHDCVAEGGGHEELLQHRIHLAYAAQIADAGVA